MIDGSKWNHALRALHRICVRGRWLAGERNFDAVYRLMDDAEILPKYLAEPTNRTREFRSALEGISADIPGCASIIVEFDEFDCRDW